MAGLEKAGVQLVAEDASRFFGDMSKASGAVNNFSDDTTRAAGRTSSASDIMTGALRHIGTIAVDAFLQAGRAAVGFVSDSISAAGDFESGMNKFAAVAGGALEESGLSLKQFRDQFIQIGKELPVSTAEVQQAAIEMVKGGIDPATIAAGGLKQVIQFAAAADLDLAQAATISAKAIGGWVSQSATAQERADFLTHSTDLLAKAANASTVDVDDLALGLYNVQGPAKLAGVSFDETVTTLAQLAPSFASSADAGTSFKTFLSRLQPTAAPAAAAMEGLGLWTKEAGSAFYDAQGNFVGMEKASQLLSDATKDLTEAERAQILTTIFGQDGIRTAAVLSEQGAAGYDAMTAALQKQNSVQEMAAQKQAGFNTAMDNFKGSIEALQITIGSALLPILTDLFNNYLAPGINTLTTLAGAIFGDADAFAQLTPELQGVAQSIQVVVGVVSDLLGEGGGIGVFADDIREMTGIDIMPLVNGFNALVASFQDTGAESDNLGGVLDDLSATWDNLTGVVDKVMSAYQAIAEAVLPIVSGFIEDHGAEIDGFFQDTYDSIMEIINTALDLYEAIVPPVLNAIAKFITDHGEEIQDIIDGVWKQVTAIIDAALTLIKGILKTALQLIQGDWEGAWKTIKETGKRLWEDIKQLIDGQIKVIQGIFGGMFDWLGNKATEGWNAIKSKVDEGIGDVVDLFNSLPDKVSGVGEAVMNSIWDGMRRVWDQLMAWLNEQLAAAADLLPGSEPKDPRSPLRGLKRRGAAIIGNLMEGMQAAGPLMTPSMIAPPALVVPRPSVQLIQPASTTTNNMTTNNYSGNAGGGAISSDHLFAMFGSRG
jgi:trimeric autotransporter adhesin